MYSCCAQYFFFFFFSVIDISGEDGASPLHYAARFRANVARTSPSRQVSQVVADGENETDGVVENVVGAVVTASLAQALSANSLSGEVNHALSQV